MQLPMKALLLAALVFFTSLAVATEGGLRTSGTVPPASLALNGPSLASDDDFLAAREAFRVGDAAQIDRLAPRFALSPLEPYLTYYRLHMHLDTADAASIKQFL